MGGGGGQGGCERRIEVIVKCKTMGGGGQVRPTMEARGVGLVEGEGVGRGGGGWLVAMLEVGGDVGLWGM